MKNIWKKALLIFIGIICLCSLRVFGQEQVVFMHGLGNDGPVWTNSYNMISKLKQDGWNFTSYNPTRTTSTSISSQAQAINNLVYYNTSAISVGHSMGAASTRMYMDQYGTNKLNRMITLDGTNNPVYLAESLYNGNAITFTRWQGQVIGDISLLVSFELMPSWLFSYAWPITTYVGTISSNFASLIPGMYQNDATYDLSGRGTGFQYLNNTSETYTRVGIIGQDGDAGHSFYRLGATAANLHPSWGTGVQDVLSYGYYWGSWDTGDAGDYYDSPYIDGYYNYDYDPYLANWYYLISDEFWADYVYVTNSGYNWAVVNGSIAGGYWYFSDGVLPNYTQGYNNATANYTIPNSTNHFLVTQTDDGKKAIEWAFQNKVNFKNTPFPPTVSISPSSSAAPSGGSYQFTANISKGSGNFTINWYYYYPSPGGGGLPESAFKGNGDKSDGGPILSLPAGTGGWAFLGSGSSVWFQPIVKNQLKVTVTDNVLGVTTEAINYW